MMKKYLVTLAVAVSFLVAANAQAGLTLGTLSPDDFYKEYFTITFDRDADGNWGNRGVNNARTDLVSAHASNPNAVNGPGFNLVTILPQPGAVAVYPMVAWVTGGIDLDALLATMIIQVGSTDSWGNFGVDSSFNPYQYSSMGSGDYVTNLWSYLRDDYALQFVFDNSVLDLVSGGGGWFTFHVGEISQVPEPATLAVLGLGLAGLGVARRRMKK